MRVTKFVARLQAAYGKWQIANFTVIFILIRVIVWDMGTPESHQKSKFSTSKEEIAKNLYGVYLTEFADSTKNH
jgi:hypothetical protein